MLTNVTYMDSSGGDDKQGGTQAQPVRTVARAMELCSIDGWRAQNKLFDITPGGGNFSFEGATGLRIGVPLGSSATPFAIVGQLGDLFGSLANAVASSTQLQVPIPGSVRVSTIASIVAGAPAGQMRVSGVPGYTAADNNKLAKVSGANKGINNGTFIIINGAAAAGAIDVLNAGAITGDAITVHDSYDLDTITITSGAQAGQTRIVRDTTVAGGNLTLEVLEPFVDAIGIIVEINVGDTFTVGEPVTKIDIRTGELDIFQNGPASLGLKNIAFSGNVLFFGRMSVNAVSCWFTNRSGSATPGKMTLRNGAQLIGGADGGDFWAADGLDNPFSFTRQLRTGVGYKNVEVLAANQASLFFNAHLFRSCKVTVNRAKAVFQPGDGRRTIFIFNPGSIVDFLGTAAQPSKFQGQLASDPATGILNYNGAVSQQLANVVINNSGGHGLRVAQKGFVLLIGTLGGSGNAGVGVKAVDQSEVIIPGGAVGITIAGIAGESKVGTRDARLWASYATTNPVNQEFDMSGDGSRIAAAGAASNALPQEPPGTGIASAASITLTNTLHHVSGVAALSVMTPPGGTQFRGVVYLIADGDFTWDTVGNFGTAGKAESGRVFPFVFDGAKWWPVNVKK